MSSRQYTCAAVCEHQLNSAVNDMLHESPLRPSYDLVTEIATDIQCAHAGSHAAALPANIAESLVLPLFYAVCFIFLG